MSGETPPPPMPTGLALVQVSPVFLIFYKLRSLLRSLFLTKHNPCGMVLLERIIMDKDVLFDLGEPKPLAAVPELPPEEPKPEIPDPTEPMVFEPPLAGAEFSPCGHFRYSLWRRWKELGKMILFVGLNPSVAGKEFDDNTVRRWIGFSKREDAAWFAAVNISPFIATDQKNLRKQYNTPFGDGGVDCHPFYGEMIGVTDEFVNVDAILKHVDQADVIVLCWGAGGAMNGVGRHVYQLINSATTKPILCFGTTKSGEPKHPLRLSSKTPLVPFSYDPVDYSKDELDEF